MGGSGGMDPAEEPKMKEEIVEFIQKRSETNPRYADRLRACGVLQCKRARAAAARQHCKEAAIKNSKNKDADHKESGIEKVGRKRSLSCSRSQTSAACCSRRRRRRYCPIRRRRRSCCPRKRRRSCRRRRRSRCGRRRRRSRCRRRRRRSCRRRRRCCRRRPRRRR